jgi:D-amino-acid dehydrogenase
MDETYKVAITRLGDTIRIAGIAELTGYDKSLSKSGDRITQFVLKDLFPKAAEQVEDDHLWAGLRPMTPDGTPIIGKTPYDNLFLNTGHGTLGWTMGLGSGKIISSIISEKKPEIDIEGLDMFRYQ